MIKPDIGVLLLSKISWESVDADHIKVVFAGNFDENYAGLEADLNRAQVYAVKRTYDKINNKTITIYKRTKNYVNFR